MAHLREQGLDISGYIDDSLCIGHDASEFTDLMIYTVKFFDKFGYTVHLGKSVLPHVSITKEIEYLGLKFHSTKITHSDRQKERLHSESCNKASCSYQAHIKQLAQFLGKRTVSEPGFVHAPLY